MKRNELAPPAYPTNYPAPSLQTSVFAAQVSESVSEGAGHSLLVPLHYEKNYAYPLIVWLHSGGDNERQLKRVMPLVSLRNYVAIAPRGASEDHIERAYRWRQTTHDILEAQARVTRCIDVARRRCHIHPERIFVGGYADGGTMALRIALRMPHLFAGAFSLGGGLPQSHQPLINLDRARGMSLLIAHADQSCSFDQDRLCTDIRLLHAAGMSLCVRQYPCGDELTTAMLADLDGWLMQHVTGHSCGSGEMAPDAGEWN